MCAYFQKKARIKIQTFWDETNQPFCKTHICECVHVFRKKRIKIQTFWDEINQPFCKVHICACVPVFVLFCFFKYKWKICHLYNIDICVCVRVLRKNQVLKVGHFKWKKYHPLCKIYICACVRVLTKNMDEKSAIFITSISVHVCVFSEKKQRLKFRHFEMKQISHFVKFISVRVCVFSEKSNDKIQTFWDEKNQPFCKIHMCACVSVLKRKCRWKISHLYNIDICACVRLLKKKARMKIQTFWDETNKPLCKIHICACVRLLKRKCGWKISHLYNIDICACVRLFRKKQE